MPTLPVSRSRLSYVALALLGAMPLAAQSPTVTVSGQAFLQYAYQLNIDSTLPVPGHANNFDVTRTFVNVFGKFSDGVTTRITADVDARKASASQLSLRLAYAYVSWQPHAKGPLTWKMGQMHTPWVEFEEAVWDYRVQGKSVMDRNGYNGVSDFGAGVDGNWNKDQVNLQAGIYNGEGATSPLGDQGKDAELRVSWRLAASDLPGRVGGLRLSGFADVGQANGGGARHRFVGMLSWRTKRLTAAAMVAATQDSTAPLLPHQKGLVESAFGVYNIPDTKLSLLGRVDRVDLNADSSSTAINAAANVNVNWQTRLIAGIVYTISPQLRVLTDLDFVSVQDGATTAFDRSARTLYFHTEFRF